MPAGNWNLLIGDVRDKLLEIPRGTVQTCISSPPYWNLRDYQVAGQIGNEKTPEEFIATMVDVFRLVRDTLRDDGTLWLNLGANYASRDIRSNLSHPWPHVPACDTDGKGFPNSRGDGHASDGSDGVPQDATPNRRDCIVGSVQPVLPIVPPPLQIDRDTSRSDCVKAFHDASIDGVPQSTTPQSSCQPKDASYLLGEASAVPLIPTTSSPDAHSCEHTSAYTCGTSPMSPPLDYRIQDKDVLLSACGRSGCCGIGRCGLCWCKLAIPSLNIKAGDLINIPHMVAMALQADGWILRSTVIWQKRSPMPESIRGWQWVPCRVKVKGVEAIHPNYGGNGVLRSMTGRVATWKPCPGCPKCEPNGGLVLRKGSWRPTTGHEYVFLFSKSPDYFADGDAVAEVAVCGDNGSRFDEGKTVDRTGGDRTQKGPRESRIRGYFAAAKNQEPGKEPFLAVTETRNPRSVWTLSSEPFKGAHFATFPSELVKRMLLATTPAECCATCGAGYAPVVTKERLPTRPALNPKGDWKADDTGDDSQRSDAMVNRDPERHIQRTVVHRYLPTCRCQALPARSVVLDPFAGSGTTLQVARHYGRDSIGIELSETYAAMARERIEKVPRCAVPKKIKKVPPVDRQQMTFEF